MQISVGMYVQFKEKWNAGEFNGQRFGQAFYNHFSLEKITSLWKTYLDRLYNADEDTAKGIIESLLDHSN